MPDITESEHIAGVYVVEPTIHGDQRGLFIETYRREWIPGAREMIQSNRANRQQGALDLGQAEQSAGDKDGSFQPRIDQPAGQSNFRIEVDARAIGQIDAQPLSLDESGNRTLGDVSCQAVGLGDFQVGADGQLPLKGDFRRQESVDEDQG